MTFTNCKTDLERAAYFKQKFEAIPDELWTDTGFLENPFKAGCGCALFHCGVKLDRTGYIPTPEANALANLLRTVRDRPELTPVWSINDGNVENYRQPTPRARILAALGDIIEKLEKEKNNT